MPIRPPDFEKDMRSLYKSEGMPVAKRERKSKVTVPDAPPEFLVGPQAKEDEETNIEQFMMEGVPPAPSKTERSPTRHLLKCLYVAVDKSVDAFLGVVGKRFLLMWISIEMVVFTASCYYLV